MSTTSNFRLVVATIVAASAFLPSHTAEAQFPVDTDYTIVQFDTPNSLPKDIFVGHISVPHHQSTDAYDEQWTLSSSYRDLSADPDIITEISPILDQKHLGPTNRTTRISTDDSSTMLKSSIELSNIPNDFLEGLPAAVAPLRSPFRFCEIWQYTNLDEDPADDISPISTSASSHPDIHFVGLLYTELSGGKTTEHWLLSGYTYPSSKNRIVTQFRPRTTQDMRATIESYHKEATKAFRYIRTTVAPMPPKGEAAPAPSESAQGLQCSLTAAPSSSENNNHFWQLAFALGTLVACSARRRR